MTIKVKYMRGQSQRINIRGWFSDQYQMLKEMTVHDVWFWVIGIYLTYHYLVQLTTWIIWKYYPK